MKPKILICLAVLLAAHCALADLNDGLVAYYPFDGNANDASGNGANGSAYGNVSFVPGTSGQAAHFDGNSGHILIPANNSRSFYTNTFSVVFWFRTTEQDVGYMLDSRSFSQQGYQLIIHPAGPGILWFPENDGQYYPGTFVSTEKTSFQDGNWHMVAGLRESNSVAIFIDGTLVKSKTIPADLNVGEAFPINLGTRFSLNDPSDYYTGDLDELRIYNRALSDSEIQQLYLAGGGQNLGLVAYYPFDGNANDASGNGNNGGAANTSTATDRNGNTNGALYFNGSAYVLVPASSSIDNLGNTLTLSAWIKTDAGINYSVSSDYVTLLAKGASSTFWADYDLAFGNPINTVWPFPAGSLVWENSSAQNSPWHTNSQFSVPKGSWHNIAVTFNSGQIAYYLDGSLGSTATSPHQTIRASTLPLYIG